MKTAVMTEDAYAKARAGACAVEIYRKEVTLSSFKVLDRDHIQLDGVTIEMTKRAVDRLLNYFQIPTRFAKRFEEGYGADGLAKLIEMVKAQYAAQKDRKFTLAVNPNTRQIIDVLPPKYASISNEGFLNLVERYIDNYDLKVTNFGYDEAGTTQLNCITNGVFNLSEASNELFTTGVTFRNDPSEGLVVTPYLNRLVCSNGMTSTAFSEKHALHTLSDYNVRKFNDHMTDLASFGFRPFGIGQKIKESMETNASLAELNGAFSTMMRSHKGIDPMYMQRYLPTQRIHKAYADMGHDPNGFTAKQLQAADSGVTVWGVVNAMTNFASNDTRTQLDDMARSNMMIQAGNFLMKKRWDASNAVPVNPFAKTGVMTEREAKISMGDRD